MSSETVWRRTWKPSLNSTPWTTVTRDGHGFLYKCLVKDNCYEFILSDQINAYSETADQAKIMQRTQKLNPSVEVPIHKLLDHISSHMDNLQSSKVSIKTTEERCVVSLETKLAGLPFVWKFIASPCEPELVSEHITLPLMGMVAELLRRQAELAHLLQRKDKEIEDYKAQGAKVTRKHLMTAPFDETAFKDSMTTSQGFERMAAHLGESTFSGDGQQLYTDLMMKRTWLAHRNDEEDEGPSSPKKPNTSGESWNARVPASVISPSVSPNKSPTKAAPDKLSDSPAKDTEALRRQALERKLAEEEDKKVQKKKKKKLKL